MKTGNISSGDVIWTNNVDLLTDEGCLPVIGSCQVSSILSNLDSSVDKIENHTEPPQNIDLTVLGNSDLRLPQPQLSTDTVQNNFVVFKENGTNKTKAVEKSGNLKNDSFEDLFYFVCNLCQFLCTENDQYTDHLQNAHKNKPPRKLLRLRCPACANMFFHKMPLRSHLVHDHGVRSSEINQIVENVFYNATKALALANDGKKNKASPKPAADLKASKSFSFEASTEGQASKTVNLPKVEITQNNAEKMFNTMMNQQNSVSKLISVKKIHKCVVPSCKIQLQNVDNLNYHISCHKDNGFVCLVCNETFSLWKPLASHLWRLHKINMELYSCDKCDYKSVSLAKLNNIHKLIHGDVKAYVCNVCKKAFKNSKQLGNHKITHKSQYERLKFTCEVCSRSFSDKRQLKIHMDVVHEKIKPYLCNYCSYKGSSRSSLKMHIRQHTGEKPFACDSCSYTTSDHNSLRRHKLRHTGQKPYKCSYCSYACIQSSTYKVHLKTKHPGQEKDLMFTCQECQFRSVNKEMYVSHMVTVHDQKPQG